MLMAVLLPLFFDVDDFLWHASLAPAVLGRSVKRPDDLEQSLEVTRKELFCFLGGPVEMDLVLFLSRQPFSLALNVNIRL